MENDSNGNQNSSGNLDAVLREYLKKCEIQQEYLDRHFPRNIPNDVCNHAFIEGIKFENSFQPKIHDFVPFMKYGDEELFLWTHTKDKETALVSLVSNIIKDKNFWKNIGTVIQLSYSYSRDFEHDIDLEYRWFYYFDSNKSIAEHTIYQDSDRNSILNGTILKLTDLYDLSPIIELLLRDDKAFTAMSNFYSSMRTHYCCLICELEKYPVRKHLSHEPEIWEQANVISEYEIAIVQACRCVEALIGKPSNKDNRSRLLDHKKSGLINFLLIQTPLFKKQEPHTSISIIIYLNLEMQRHIATEQYLFI